MFVDVTWQDWAAAPESERLDLLLQIVQKYKSSTEFRIALEANRYFASDNPEIARKVMVKPRAIQQKDENGCVKESVQMHRIAGNRVRSNFLSRFIIQENQFLLGHGVTLKDTEQKKKLGPGFDTALAQMGEKALLHGVCWGFWNVDHIEVLEAAKDGLSGFVAVLDEMSGAPMMGVQFWQLTSRRPLYVRLFEADGMTLYKRTDGVLVEEAPKRGYIRRSKMDAMGAFDQQDSAYSGVLPIIPLYGNPGRCSELTLSIKTKIDLYDRILSDFGDNLDRANDVYWVLNNFGGTTSDIVKTLEYIHQLKAVLNVSDGTGSGSTAEPKTLEVPHQARKAALDLLEGALYADFMALDMDAMTGSSLTNVAIEAAMTNLNLKADRYEWQCFAFVQGVLRLLGMETEEIRFQRAQITNRSEIVKDVALMRSDIDHRTALTLYPYIEQDAVDGIVDRVNEEKLTGGPEV